MLYTSLSEGLRQMRQKKNEGLHAPRVRGFRGPLHLGMELHALFYPPFGFQ